MTNPSRARILIVDDEPSICEVLGIALSKDGYEVNVETDPRRALDLFRARPHDIVIHDLRMPQMDGLELLQGLLSLSPDVIVIIMTAYSTWDRAVEAMRMGAYDYIRKPFDTQTDVRAAIQRAIRAKEHQAALGGSFDEALNAVGMLVGDSPSMKAVRDLIRRAAPADSGVLIEGESGSGKELVAHALHYFSPRSNHPFVTVNCGAIPENLLESELFGHVKGAFTGAVAEKAGLLDVSNGGTFFFDEISEMSLALQVKLLRVLEEREFKPVGSVQTRRVDVRFIAATNRDLKEEVNDRRFRRDLYYRLNVIPIRVPPLRERREDIAMLSGYFLRKFCRKMGKEIRGFSLAAREAMMDYPWIGNVRELENCIERSVALGEGDEITERDLFQTLRLDKNRMGGELSEKPLTEEGMDLDRLLSDMELSYLKQALALSKGSYTGAAQILRMSLRSFRYRLQKHGLTKEGENG